MLFNSYQFLFFFLPMVLGISLRLKGRRLTVWITLASFAFYARVGHAWFLAPMLFTTTLDFFLAQRLEKARRKKRLPILLLSLICNLGLLAIFKYSALVLDFIPESTRLWRVSLPAGISFYTFQTVSYMVDVYRGEAKAERSFWRFAGFVSFFPHLVAGPLTRHHQLIPALARMEGKGLSPRWQAGFFLFAIGLCKKVLIADRIASHIDPLLLETGTLIPAQAWLCLSGYALQIYFDFSGYSDMAIGLGRLFGVELPLNFNSPYQAENPSDFWRRWHITLSSWLRDYLYISLGGNRCSPFRRRLNLMVTMVLGGLWHGANWTFAGWGFYHGLLLVAYDFTRKPWDRLPRLLRQVLTFFLVAQGWVFFRAPTFADAWSWFRALYGAGAPGNAAAGTESALLGVLLTAGLIVAFFFKNSASNHRLERLSPIQQTILGFGVVVAFLFMNLSSRFLYFQF